MNLIYFWSKCNLGWLKKKINLASPSHLWDYISFFFYTFFSPLSFIGLHQFITHLWSILKSNSEWLQWKKEATGRITPAIIRQDIEECGWDSLPRSLEPLVFPLPWSCSKSCAKQTTHANPRSSTAEAATLGLHAMCAKGGREGQEGRAGGEQQQKRNNNISQPTFKNRTNFSNSRTENQPDCLLYQY